MRTEQHWSLWAALALFAQLCALHSLPYDLSGGGASLWRALACAGIALLLWIAADGNRLLHFLLKRRA
jgi:hypothetical protein